eukprot:313445_1
MSDDSDEYTDTDEETSPIVIDIGSQTLKAEYAGKDAPQLIPCVVYTPGPGVIENGYCKSVYSTKAKKIIPNDIIDVISKYNIQPRFIGDQVATIQSLLHPTYPVQNGRMTSNMDFMAELFQYTITEKLKAIPEEHSILLTESPNAPKKEREDKMQLMFELLNVPATYIGVREVLALYAYGLTTGVVLQCGHDVTFSVPIYEGYALPHGIRESTIAGKQVTNYLHQLLCCHNYNLSLSTVEQIKEKCCYFADNYDDVKNKLTSYGKSVNYELPDGTILSLPEETLIATEVLFAPKLMGFKDNGMHKLAGESISKCDIDIRVDIYKHICLSGGSTMMGGIEDRMYNEMLKLSPGVSCDKWPKIYAQTENGKTERKYLSWVGGSILSSLSTFPSMWISKDEYDDSGPGIVHRKCF